MPVSVAWDPKTPDVIIVCYQGRWRWSEHHEAMDHLRAKGLAHKQPYTIIVDIIASDHHPPGAYSQIGHSIQNPPPNWNGLAFLITPENRMQDTMTTLVRLYNKFTRKQTYLHAESYEQAFAMISDLNPENIKP